MPVTIRSSWGAVSTAGRPGTGAITYATQYRVTPRGSARPGGYVSVRTHAAAVRQVDDSIAWGGVYQARVQARRSGAQSSVWRSGNEVTANHPPEYAASIVNETVASGAVSAQGLGTPAADADISDGDSLSYAITEVRYRAGGTPSGATRASHGFTVGADGRVAYSGTALVDGDIWEVDVEATDLLGENAEYTLAVHVGSSPGNVPTWSRNQDFVVPLGGSTVVELDSYATDGDGGEASSYALTDVADFTPLSGVTVALSGSRKEKLTISAAADAEVGTYDIQLSATDDDGTSKTSGWTVTVESTLPAPSFLRSVVR